MPHLFLDTEYSLWIDSNIKINENIYLLIENMLKKKKKICLYNHDKRKNIKEESEVCKSLVKMIKKLLTNKLKSEEKLGSLNKFDLFRAE